MSFVKIQSVFYLSFMLYTKNHVVVSVDGILVIFHFDLPDIGFF